MTRSIGAGLLSKVYRNRWHAEQPFAWILLALLALATCTASMSISAQSLVCTDCHFDSNAKVRGKHAAAELTCETCHTASEAHLADPGQASGIVFNAGDIADQNQPCLGCHDNGKRVHWSASAHQLGNVACADCHKSHSGDPMLKRATAQQACLACHSSIKHTLHQRSRHPVKELKTVCTDCHASHGSLSASGELVESSVRQLCLECHKEKTGPYLFEHEPVTEDCGLCHKPHGSQHPSLLKSRSPFLCQQCHIAADHPGQLPRGLANSNIAGGGCLNCHGAIHGSNHPSGARLIK